VGEEGLRVRGWFSQWVGGYPYQRAAPCCADSMTSIGNGSFPVSVARVHGWVTTCRCVGVVVASGEKGAT
jgi:hypothetical protein